MRKLEDIRRPYLLANLSEENLPDDPMTLFYQWWDEALASEMQEPNAMILATVDTESRPSARTVLLKSASAEGFEFYTNYQSRKAKDLEANPHVALVLLWKEQERQVRIEGVAEKVDKEKSQVYFQSRPRGSQLGAWASPQSSVITDRTELESGIEKYAIEFENVDPLPCPEHWGGYLVRPSVIEYWQGRADRLHDRFRFSVKDGKWEVCRLAP